MAIDELRKIRKKLGMSLADASQIEVSRQSWASIEKGVSEPGVGVLQSLAKLYGYEFIMYLEQYDGARCIRIDLV